MKDRIKKLIEKLNTNTVEFANEIGINVTTLNAALNRNQTVNTPIIQAILNTFPDINAEWLLLGKEPMYKGDKAYLEPTLFDNENQINPNKSPGDSVYAKEIGVKMPQNNPKQSINHELSGRFLSSKKIDKIVIFYTDNTFTTLTPDE